MRFFSGICLMVNGDREELTGKEQPEIEVPITLDLYRVVDVTPWVNTDDEVVADRTSVRMGDLNITCLLVPYAEFVVTWTEAIDRQTPCRNCNANLTQ